MLSKVFKSCRFSEGIKHNEDVLLEFSPDGYSYACALQSHLLVKDKYSRKIIQKFVCQHYINGFKWSPDSKLIFCTMPKASFIQVWSTENPTWNCKIEEYPLLICDVFWAPDSCHILILSEFHLRINVRSLVSTSSAEIECPKPVRDCVSFSSCGKFLAVASAKKGDQVKIFTCDTFEILKVFPVETKDLSGIYFSPSELTIAVLEATNEEARVLFYCIDGRLVAEYRGSFCFGFTRLSWSCDGRFVAVAHQSEQVTILRSGDFSETSTCRVPDVIEHDDIVVYRAFCELEETTSPSQAALNCDLFRVVKDRPLSLSSQKSRSEKSRPKTSKCRIRAMQFSPCGRFLALVSGSVPNAISIFDRSKNRISSVVINSHAVKGISWHPKLPILAFCTGSCSLEMWTPSCCINIPSPFADRITSASWGTGMELLLNSKTRSSVLYLPPSPPLDFSPS